MGGRRLERGGRRSYSVTGAAGDCLQLQGRGRETLAREMEEWGEEKKGRKEKKKGNGGKVGGGAGQLGPTTHFLTCGIVPRQ